MFGTRITRLHSYAQETNGWSILNSRIRNRIRRMRFIVCLFIIRRVADQRDHREKHSDASMNFVWKRFIVSLLSSSIWNEFELTVNTRIYFAKNSIIPYIYDFNYTNSQSVVATKRSLNSNVLLIRRKLCVEWRKTYTSVGILIFFIHTCVSQIDHLTIFLDISIKFCENEINDSVHDSMIENTRSDFTICRQRSFIANYDHCERHCNTSVSK